MCTVVRLLFIYWSAMVSGLVLMIVVYLMLLNVVGLLSLGVGLCIVSLCSGCAGYSTFSLIYDACSLMCFGVVVFLFCRVGDVSL